MPIPIYDCTAPVFRQMLECQMALLHKADAHCEATNTDPISIVNAKLSPRSQTYGEHVRSLTRIANQTSSRLADTPLEKPNSKGNDLGKLITRVAHSLNVVNSLTRDNFSAAETRTYSVINTNGETGNVSAHEYLAHF